MKQKNNRPTKSCAKTVKSLASQAKNRMHKKCYGGNDHLATAVAGYSLHRYFGVTEAASSCVKRHEYYYICHTLRRSLEKHRCCSSKLNELVTTLPRRSNRTSSAVTENPSFLSSPPPTSTSSIPLPSPSSMGTRHSPRLILKEGRSRNDIWLAQIQKKKFEEYRSPTYTLIGRKYKKRINSTACSIIASCVDFQVCNINQIQYNHSLASECLKVLQAVQYEIECITRVPGLASNHEDNHDNEEDNAVGSNNNKFQTAISMLTSLSQSKYDAHRKQLINDFKSKVRGLKDMIPSYYNMSHDIPELETIEVSPDGECSSLTTKDASTAEVLFYDESIRSSDVNDTEVQQHMFPTLPVPIVEQDDETALPYIIHLFTC